MSVDPFGALPGGPQAPGWFGKLPALGDFASRRLPESFTAAWDAWLSRSLESSRAQLASRWLDTYLHGPIWSFALLPGSIDSSTWYGVMMPSVDRVGRYYPLTIATATDYAVPPANLDAWMQELRDTAMACLDPQATVEQLEATLAPQLLRPALPGPDPAMPAEGRPVRWPGHSGSLAATLGATGGRLIWRALAGCTLWWTTHPQLGQATGTGLTVCRGLPDARAFQSLIEGR